MAVNCTLGKNIIKCFARPEPLPACCERARTKERRYWGEGQQLAKPSRSLLCNFSIKRGDGNAHLHCPQLLQSQDHSPIWSMGRCQHPTPKEGSSCSSSMLTRASLQFFSRNWSVGNWCWKCAKSVQNLFYLAELKNWFWANLTSNVASALSTYLLLSRKALQRLSNILAWYFQQQDVIEGLFRI